MTFIHCPDCGAELMLGFVVRVNKSEFSIQPEEVESAAWYSIDEAKYELSKGMTGKDLLRDWLDIADK